MNTNNHTTHVVSENTLMNVEAVLLAGKPKTGKQIARAIKRAHTTVYRALALLAEQGKVMATKKGRAKRFVLVQETKPITTNGARIDRTTAIKAAVLQYLQKHGPTPQVMVVQKTPFPRGTTYAVVAEMRRGGDVVLQDGKLSIPAATNTQPTETLKIEPALPQGEVLGALLRTLEETAGAVRTILGKESSGQMGLDLH